MEFIEELAKAVANLLQKNLGGDALGSVLEFLIYITLGIFVWYIGPIAMMLKPVRRLVRQEERYAGNYIQIVQSGDERRYSIISIFYRSKMRSYLLKGYQYDPEGHRAIDFSSERVTIVESVGKSIEFVWKGEAVNATSFFSGYTKMEMNEPDNLNLLDGRGFFITFDKVPRRVNMRFAKLTKQRLNILGLSWPNSQANRASFVVEIHKKLKNHPELEPIEESMEPLVV